MLLLPKAQRVLTYITLAVLPVLSRPPLPPWLGGSVLRSQGPLPRDRLPLVEQH